MRFNPGGDRSPARGGVGSCPGWAFGTLSTTDRVRHRATTPLLLGPGSRPYAERVALSRRDADLGDGRFVRTDRRRGLHEEHVERAIVLLGRAAEWAAPPPAARPAATGTPRSAPTPASTSSPGVPAVANLRRRTITLARPADGRRTIAAFPPPKRCEVVVVGRGEGGRPGARA